MRRGSNSQSRPKQLRKPSKWGKRESKPRLEWWRKLSQSKPTAPAQSSNWAHKVRCKCQSSEAGRRIERDEIADERDEKSDQGQGHSEPRHARLSLLISIHQKGGQLSSSIKVQGSPAEKLWWTQRPTRLPGFLQNGHAVTRCIRWDHVSCFPYQP